MSHRDISWVEKKRKIFLAFCRNVWWLHRFRKPPQQKKRRSYKIKKMRVIAFLYHTINLIDKLNECIICCKELNAFTLQLQNRVYDTVCLFPETFATLF